MLMSRFDWYIIFDFVACLPKDCASYLANLWLICWTLSFYSEYFLTLVRMQYLKVTGLLIKYLMLVNGGCNLGVNDK